MIDRQKGRFDDWDPDEQTWRDRGPDTCCQEILDDVIRDFTKRRFSGVGRHIALGAAAALTSLTMATQGVAQERPNIILMMADDMGWGDPSYNNGWIQTPNLDAMAGKSLKFTRFYSAAPTCSPTRASCLTGRNPVRVGVPYANQGRLERSESVLSEVLDQEGYRCGHFGKWHLGTLTTLTSDSNRGGPGSENEFSPPWLHRFSTCFSTEAKVPTYHPMRLESSNANPEPVDFNDPNFYGTRYWRPPLDPSTWTNETGEGVAVSVTNNLSGDDSRVMMDRVIPYIQDRVASNESFFAVIWFHTPHKPLVDPELSSAVDSEDAYIDAIQDMDTQIGRLRAELEALGVRTNTMLWFCSDNGPENNVAGQTGGLRARKRSLHEGGVRVPALLEWPAMIPVARTTDYPCVTSDYYPTIVDALDLTNSTPNPLDGISLMPLITNANFNAARASPIGFLSDNQRSWVTHQYKLISKDDGNTYELYDLLADMTETNDIAAVEPRIAARLQEELETWITSVNEDTEYVPPPLPTGWWDPGVSNETVTVSNALVYATLGVPSGSNTAVTLEWDTTNAPSGGWAFTNATLPDSTGGLVTAWLSGLDADTEYWFRFLATNAVDVNDTSTPVRVVTHLSSAQTPTIGSITTNNTDVTLVWMDRDTYGTGFMVEYYAEGSAVTNHQVVASTNWTHHTATADTRFFYRVGATNAGFGGSFSGYSSWTNAVTGEIVASTGSTTTLTSPVFNTVDSQGDIPGDDSNNLDKFSPGGSFEAEFATTLYVRGNATDADRQVKAYARFDLSSLPAGTVTGAVLRFRGYSLNDINSVGLLLDQLAEDWPTSGTPYTPAVTGVAATVADVMTAGAPLTGSNFVVDVTAIVSNWVEGAANHGFFICLENMAINNGLGISTGGVGAIALDVYQAGVVDPDDTDGDGISDAWELAYWGELGVADGSSISDSDPHTDLEEYIADTNPTNADSFFQLRGIEYTNDVRVLFRSSTGRLYVLQFSDDLLVPSGWSNVPGLLPRAGTGTNDFMTDTNDAPHRFYRLRVTLP